MPQKPIQLRPLRALAISDALRLFDQLPDAAHVREPVVKALYGFSGATLWRRVKDKTIPAPKKLSARVSAWNVGELRRAITKASGGENVQE